MEIVIADNKLGEELIKLGAKYLGRQEYDISSIEL